MQRPHNGPLVLKSLVTPFEIRNHVKNNLVAILKNKHSTWVYSEHNIHSNG